MFKKLVANDRKAFFKYLQEVLKEREQLEIVAKEESETTSDHMDRLCEELAQTDMQGADAFVLYYTGHGGRGSICCVDNYAEFPISRLMEALWKVPFMLTP